MPLWIRYSFCLFCQIMRIRNKNYFTWLALCNAGGSYGKGRSHLGIHFGFCLTQQSNCPDFVVGTCDNSQMKFEKNINNVDTLQTLM